MKGFTLLEVLVAIFITSLVIVIYLNFLSNMNIFKQKNLERLNNIDKYWQFVLENDFENFKLNCSEPQKGFKFCQLISKEDFINFELILEENAL